MPAKPQWILRVPEILVALEQLTVPVVDRLMVERLFGLRRRQSISLLHRFGGYQAGRTFLVDRQALMECLRALQKEDVFVWEAHRRERLEADLQKVRLAGKAKQIQIPVTREVLSLTVSELTEDIRLKAGCLEIRYADTQDLLAKLLQLAKAAANDYIAFQQASS